MKIKLVCELTGLTDRTIRYYIEEKLVSPLYTENYFGRKTYTFSEKDIKELNDIAVLRKFGFTVAEIKSVVSNAETSREILSNVKTRTAQAISDGQSRLSALSQINTEKIYTVAELAEELSKASLVLPNYRETIKISLAKRVLSTLKAVLILAIVWLPIAISVFGVIRGIHNYHYPVFEPLMILGTLICFWPSIAVLIISKTKVKWKKIAVYVLLIVCVLSIPDSALISSGVVSKSETTEFVNYYEFDPGCLANRDELFQELFPSWPKHVESLKQADGTYKTVYLDAHYYYQYSQGWDSTYDIYAEWPLNEDDYTDEVKRVSLVFEKAEKNNTDEYYSFVKQKKGDYNCLIRYSGNKPFTAVTDSYEYMIFAYNDKTNKIRYICCYSLENGADRPYYLQLDW